MLRNKRRFFWVLIGLLLAGALWALDVEVTYEHNVRHGIPADFRSRHQPAVYKWQT